MAKRATYKRLPDGSVLVRIPTDQGHCTLCTVRRDLTVEFFAGCPPVKTWELIRVVIQAAEILAAE